MRGDNELQGGMYSYISPEQRVPADHPLRPIRKMTDEIFKQLSPRFDKLYSRVGRPSIAPERLLRALLLQVLYSVRSERMLMEQLQYNMLFRWFVGLNMDDEVWNATTFSKNRDRLLRGAIAEEFFSAVLDLARAQELLSDEHFTVDGTMVEGWASLKSFQPKDRPERGNNDKPDDPGNPTVNFHGQKRSNKTHESTTDADLRLFKKTKGSEAKLAYQGHVLIARRTAASMPENWSAVGAAASESREDFDWMLPPRTLVDPAPWDQYWRDQFTHGVAGFVHMFCDDGKLVDLMRANELRTVLCVGSGISLEPCALAWAGFDVTALDLSPFAMDMAKRATPSDEALAGLVGGRSPGPNGHAEFVVGDLCTVALCPGPYDVVIERKTLQLYPDGERPAAMKAATDRLALRGIFFSQCHDGGWRPPAPRRHRIEPWFVAEGWKFLSDDTPLTGRVAWLFTTTG